MLVLPRTPFVSLHLSTHQVEQPHAALKRWHVRNAFRFESDTHNRRDVVIESSQRRTRGGAVMGSKTSSSGNDQPLVCARLLLLFFSFMQSPSWLSFGLSFVLALVSPIHSSGSRAQCSTHLLSVALFKTSASRPPMPTTVPMSASEQCVLVAEHSQVRVPLLVYLMRLSSPPVLCVRIVQISLAVADKDG